MFECTKEFCSRLCCPVYSSQPTRNETDNLNDAICEYNKKYLVKRKSKITFVICFMSAIYAYTFYNLYASMPTSLGETIENCPYPFDLLGDLGGLLGDVSKTCNDILYYKIRVELGMHSFQIIPILLLMFARYYWNHYKLSTRAVITSYFLKVLFPFVLLFVPLRYIEIGGDLNDYIQILIMLFITAYLVYTSLLPIALLFHNLVFTSNSLWETYQLSPEFKIASMTIMVIYSQLVVLVIGIGFQIDGFYSYWKFGYSSKYYDWTIVAILFCYICLLMIPFYIKPNVLAFRKIRLKTLLDYIFFIPFIIFVLVLFEKYTDVFEMFLSTLVASIFNR